VVEAERGRDHVTLISGPADRDWGIRTIFEVMGSWPRISEPRVRPCAGRHDHQLGRSWACVWRAGPSQLGCRVGHAGSDREFPGYCPIGHATGTRLPRGASDPDHLAHPGLSIDGHAGDDQRGGGVLAEGPRRTAVRRGHRGHAERWRRPGHPGHRGPGHALDKIAFYGAGWQIHAENLAAYLAGRERGDTEARWDDLLPPYQELAASIG